MDFQGTSIVPSSASGKCGFQQTSLVIPVEVAAPLAVLASITVAVVIVARDCLAVTSSARHVHIFQDIKTLRTDNHFYLSQTA